MCGFVIACFNEEENIDYKNEFLNNSCNKYIKSRGPSYQDSYKSNNLFCYQSVLSIQRKNKNPKFLNPIGSEKFLLYNGEIYDRSKLDPSFNTGSDTELLNKLHSEGLLSKNIFDLDGMFAVCAVEKENDCSYKIDFYRDLNGEKHLWYFQDNNIFIISSVPSVIVDYLKKFSSLEIDKDVLFDYLARRHLISPVNHIIKGIKQILPGSHYHFSTESWTNKFIARKNISDYFDHSLYKELSYKPQEYINELTSFEFKNVMKSMIDVCSPEIKQSSILSGGIDSSLVSAFLEDNYSSNFEIFTLLIDEKDFVSPHAEVMVKKINRENKIAHNLIQCTPKDYYEALLHSIKILSSPVNTHSIPSSFLVAKNAAKGGNHVLYGGEGADELFLGYECYLKNQKSYYNCQNKNFIKFPALFKKLNTFEISELIEKEKDTFQKKFLLNELTNYEININREFYVDYSIQLPNVGLISTDTINSDLGIECRTPFTRLPLIKLALSIPLNKKINRDNFLKTKIPLKEIFSKTFGIENIFPKVGFAGYPNESDKYLVNIENWNIWSILDIKPIAKEDLTRDEYWKLLNIELFYRLIFNDENLSSRVY